MATANSVIDSQNEEWYTTRDYEPVTITIASPGVLTRDDHGLLTNDRIKLFTTGAIPTGLSVDTFYYVIYITAHTFELTSSRDGTAINTSGTQSGSHSFAQEKAYRVSPGFQNNR